MTLGHEFSGEIVEVGADVKDFKLVTVSLLKLHSMFVMSVNTVNQKTIIYATIEKVLEHKLMAHLLIMSLHVKKV